MVDEKIRRIMVEYKEFRESAYQKINEVSEEIIEERATSNETIDNLLILLGGE